MIGNNMAKSAAAASVDFIEVDTPRNTHKYVGADISDYDCIYSNNKIVKITIVTMDGKSRTFEGNISVHIVFKGTN